MKDEEEFALALEAATRASMVEGEEAKGAGPLTADMLTDEVKAAMGLDMYPKDIQDAILALSYKITAYVEALAADESAEAKGGFGGPGAGMARPYAGAANQPFGRKLINCWGEVPSGRIMQRSAQIGIGVARTTKNPALAIGAFGATSIGLTARSIHSCMRR